MLISWEELPENMQTEEVKKYYNILRKKRFFLIIKRLFDVLTSLLLLFIVSPVMLCISIAVKCDSDGPILYRQKRITACGKEFRIHKFRTMVTNADKIGPEVTVGNDARITRSGMLLRKFRLDELPQLIDILQGNMSFVGTRPEVKKYVAQYTDEMMATLLLPAGLTSVASIKYKDEDKILAEAQDAEKTYVEQVLPEKMKYNLKYLRKANVFTDIGIMLLTVLEVFFKRGNE